MKTIGISIFALLVAAAACPAQQWEFGGTAGAGFLNTVNVTTPLAAATAGFQTGYGFGAFFGQNLYRHFSGELHYAYLESDLKLAASGTTATFSGGSHVVHYDFIWHTNRPSRAQFFVAVGGGMKIFDATGAEQAYQPLSQFGYFTKTRSIQGMGDFGAGVRYALSPHLFVRTEFRDYITAFPTAVLTPAPGAKYGSVLHDLVPMVGISYQP